MVSKVAELRGIEISELVDAEEAICRIAGSSELEDNDRVDLLVIIEKGPAHRATRMKSRITEIRKSKIAKLVRQSK